MSLVLPAIFVVLLAAYLYSTWWAGVDSRYPIVIAVGLLLASAALTAANDPDAANTFTLYVFFLLVGGLVLILAERRRASHLGPRPAGGPGE